MYIIHFSDLQQSQVHIFEAGNTHFSGALADAPNQPQQSAIVLIPSRHVMLTRVKVPSKNKQKINQAVPYLLEDDLIDPIEEQHFSIGQQGKNQQVPVAVIKTELLQQLQQKLEAKGYKIKHIFPDVLALPWQKHTWTLLRLHDMVLVRTGRYAGFVSEIANLNCLLNKTLQQTEHKPKHLQLLNGKKIAVVLQLDETIEYHHHPVKSAMYAFELGLKQAPDLDLLQQKTHYHWQWSKGLSLSAGLIALLLSLTILKQYLLVQQLKQQQQQQQQQVKQLFHDSFPEIKRLVNPRIQMERQLAKLQQQQAVGDTDFLILLTKMQSILLKTPDLQIKQLNYQQQQIELQLFLPNLEKVEQFKQKIEATGLKVSIQSANSEQQQVAVRLRIQSAIKVR